MSTIFPRKEKAEQIFDEILKNPHACERLKDTFFEAIPSAEESEGAGTDIPGTVFAAALFTAYENKDLSAFMMAVCNSSVFDLLRNSFLILIRFNDKGVENPIFLTDENGDLLSGSHQHACAKKYKMFHKLYEQQDEIPDYHMYMADGLKNMVIMRRGRLRHSEFQNTQEFLCFLNFRNLLHWRLTKRDLMPLYGNI